jgi:hypothetical protein
MARKTKSREINSTYLIIVEGETEQIYFQKLKTIYPFFGVNIRLKKAKHGNPLSLIHEALNEKVKGYIKISGVFMIVMY